MDELKNRRKQLSDPESAILELKSRQNLTDSEQEQLTQLESFEAELQSALDIEIPENLAEKILLDNAMEKPKSKLFSVKKFSAMAASIALVSFISLRLFLFAPNNALAEDALAHIYHDIGNLSITLPNAKEKMLRAMKAVGMTHEVNIKKLSYAANCMVGRRAGVHLVLEIDQQTYTVLLLPNVEVEEPKVFSDENFHGEIAAMDQGAFVVIAMKDTKLKPAIDNLLEKFYHPQNS